MNIQKLEEHIKSLSAEEQHVFVKDTALETNRLHKSLLKASKREGDAHINTSRKLSTTLYANTARLSQSYNDSVIMLKLAMKITFA
jgi:hypothetical protein